MDGLVILTRQEQEYLLHAIESSLELAELRELFLWAQGQLQAVLPHRMLVCMQLGPDGDVVRAELLHAGAPAPALADALCARSEGLAHAVLRRWQREGALPLALSAGAGAEEGRLAALGIGNLLAHGSGPLPGGATFFIACDIPAGPDSRHAHFLRLLLPHLHVALLRLAAGVPVLRALSPREAQVLRWLREGKNNEEIGRILGISPLTVKNHLRRLYRALGVGNRAHAVARSAALRWPLAG
ncbi:transcriptional regulator EpsA [Pseudoduganella flava]|uniref:Helix-turn-helix transcriptional regulator n=2 Tax=Pseudoduganella flava TaxID=871742 RepID=A0A562Q4Z8_9BURK|nr:helix-turn-helix transcriptional regulator [Pseudoduganella flava]TWI51813.1 transcriptional regulator EpsA [Pseudoduganella flava]